MIISNYADSDAMPFYEITDHFSQYLKELDGSKLSQAQFKELQQLCEDYPILRIMCAAMYSRGYNDFF
jgi:quinol monooxygenase YgiN